MVAEDEEQRLPTMKEGETLTLAELLPTQHFTKPPARYSEATLVKTLEKDGIGRPSTYAPIISTIQDRGYVTQRDRKFFATELGMVVTAVLEKHFQRIIDVDFTSKMEGQLDQVEMSKVNWVTMLRDFYGDLLGFKHSDVLDFGKMPWAPKRTDLGDTRGYFMRYGTDHHAFVLFNKKVLDHRPDRKFAPEVTITCSPPQRTSRRTCSIVRTPPP